MSQSTRVTFKSPQLKVSFLFYSRAVAISLDVTEFYTPKVWEGKAAISLIEENIQLFPPLIYEAVAEEIKTLQELYEDEPGFLELYISLSVTRFD